MAKKLKILDKDYVLSQTPDPSKLKVFLKKTKYKGIGLFANKDFKKNEIIAYYRFKIFALKGFKSPTNHGYSISVVLPSGKDSKTLIGDLDDESLSKPRGEIPYWAYFSNEPNGTQTPNAWIDPNIKINYKTNHKYKPGDFMTYKLRASHDIRKGSEIVWCYGDEYFRNYEPNC